jgi:hypothetical protein
MRLINGIFAPHGEVIGHVVTESTHFLVRLTLFIGKWKANHSTDVVLAKMARMDGYLVTIPENGEDYTFVFHTESDEVEYWTDKKKENSSEYDWTDEKDEDDGEYEEQQDFIADAQAWHDE